MTCRVLEKWLLNCFFPYLNELEEKKTKTNDKNSEELPLADEKTNVVKSKLSKKNAFFNRCSCL